MGTKPAEIKQRLHTFTCKKCNIIFKVDIHDTQSRQMKQVFCPLCKEKIK